MLRQTQLISSIVCTLLLIAAGAVAETPVDIRRIDKV